MAVFFADLDIGQRLTFARFLKSKRQIGSWLLHPGDTFDLLRATLLARAKLLTSFLNFMYLAHCLQTVAGNGDAAVDR